MKSGSALLLFILVCAFGSARGDVIVSGSVSTGGQQGVTCTRSGTDSFSLSCNDGVSHATAQESGGLSGSGSIDALAPANSSPFGYARSDIEIELTGTFVVIGGAGSTTISDFGDLDVTESPFGNPPSFGCRLIFNGTAQSCGSSEVVQYNVPFTIDLIMNVTGMSFDGEEANADFTYSLNPPGLPVPTP